MTLKINNIRFQLQRLIYLAPLSLTSYLFFKQKYSWLPGYSCPIRHATGVPCPSCFLTRSVCASLTGDFQYAFKLHLFGPPFALMLIFWSIISIRNKKILPIKPKKYILVMGLVSFVSYWIYRVVLHFYFGLETFPEF